MNRSRLAALARMAAGTGPEAAAARQTLAAQVRRLDAGELAALADALDPPAPPEPEPEPPHEPSAPPYDPTRDLIARLAAEAGERLADLLKPR